MLNKFDFYHMHQGTHLRALEDGELDLLKPVSYKRTEQKANALLLLHGFSSSPAVYRFMLPELKKHYDAVFVPALPGHAQSIEAFSKVRSEDWLQAVHEQFALISKEYQQVDVMGLSLGGLLACYLSQHFKIHHLYLLAPALYLRLWVKFAANLAKGLEHLGFTQLRNRAGNIVNTQHSEIAYRRLPISTIHEILSLIRDFQFKELNCPTDLFLGSHDLVVNSHAVSRLFSQKDNVDIHWLRDSAHVLPLDNNVADILKQVIKNRQPK